MPSSYALAIRCARDGSKDKLTAAGDGHRVLFPPAISTCCVAQRKEEQCHSLNTAVSANVSLLYMAIRPLCDATAIDEGVVQHTSVTPMGSRFAIGHTMSVFLCLIHDSFITQVINVALREVEESDTSIFSAGHDTISFNDVERCTWRRLVLAVMM